MSGWMYRYNQSRPIFPGTTSSVIMSLEKKFDISKTRT